MSILEFLEQWYDNYLWLYRLNDNAHQMNITRYTQNPRIPYKFPYLFLSYKL